MMGIYIKGIEMPTGNHEIIVRIQSDGRVLDQSGHRLCLEPFAVPVPPHGRLIDADALLDDLLFPSKQFEQGMRELIGDAPTIIEAEEGE